MQYGASLQAIKVNKTAYCGIVRCGRASRRPRRTVSVRSQDRLRTGPEYVSALSGLSQGGGHAQSSQGVHLNTHTCFLMQETFHLIIIWPLRHDGDSSIGSAAAAVTVLVLSARLAVRAISVAGTWSEQCAWIAVPSPHSALLVSVLSIFPFTTRLVAVNFPAVCSRQPASPPPPFSQPPLPYTLTQTLKQNKTQKQHEGNTTPWHTGSVSRGRRFYF